MGTPPTIVVYVGRNGDVQRGESYTFNPNAITFEKFDEDLSEMAFNKLKLQVCL